MSFLIIVIIVLGWIIFEKYIAKKNKDERNELFKSWDLEREKNFKKNPEFLNNYLKIKSIFKKLVIPKIDNIEIIRVEEPNHETIFITRNVKLLYKNIEFYITLNGSSSQCRSYVICNDNSKLNFSLVFDKNDDDNVIIENLIKELEVVLNRLKK